MKRVILALVLLLSLCACSTLDSGDMKTALATFASLSPTVQRALKEWVKRRESVKWLKAKNPHARVLRTECREQGPDGTWGEWRETFRVDPEDPSSGYNLLDTLVDYFRDTIENDSLNGVPFDYLSTERHLAEFELPHESALQAELRGKLTECRHAWDPGYAPDEVPQVMIDPTAEDVIDSLIASPLPPAGFAPETFSEFLEIMAPALCALGKGDEWGCPTSPLPEQTPPSGDYR